MAGASYPPVSAPKTTQVTRMQPKRRLSQRERDRQRYAQRRSTTARGYGRPHQKLRASWKPYVDAGMVECHATECLEEQDGRTRWILPGTPWDLGHNRDRTAWTGPEHRRCNRHEAAVRTNHARGQQARRSRIW